MIWDLDKLDLGQAKSNPITAAQHARQLIADGDPASLADAAKIYQAVLADPALQAPSPYRAEIQSLYGSLLCLQAQNAPEPADAAALLEAAQELLRTALAARDRRAAPEAWATTSANLALVHITRYAQTGDRTEMMTAHLALDGCAEIFLIADDAASAAWVNALRDYLTGLLDRRRTNR